MITKNFQRSARIVPLAIVLLLGVCGLSLAEETVDPGLDVVIKIDRIDKILAIIDDLAAAEPPGPLGSPTFLLRGMLQGTDWIDPARLIVIAGNLVDGRPETAALIPFRQPNDGFQLSYHAIKGPDYYLLGLPPGQGSNPSLAVRDAMVSASKTRTTALLSVEVAAARLLNTADEQIKQGLNKLGELPLETSQDSLSPYELKEFLSGFLDMAGQVDKLTLGFDLSDEKLVFSLKAKAADGTRLAETFAAPVDKTSLLSAYSPKHQINFRTQAYDVSTAMDLIEASCGNIYKKMGIDFAQLAAISHDFTGETAGGISFDKQGIKMETISVLNVPGPDIIASVLIPLLIENGNKMAGVMGKQLGQEIAPIHVRTPDSTVEGCMVMGLKTRFPDGPMPNGTPGLQDMTSLMMMETRMTTVGRLLLTASDDREIARLIGIAKGLKQGPAKGPLMTMDVDLGQYIAIMAGIVPGFPRDLPLPQTGRATSLFDVSEGRATATWSIATRDLKALMIFFNEAEKACKGPSGFEPGAEGVTTDEKDPEQPEAAPEKDAAFWTDKGALCAAYGNDETALKYFDKALELDPENSNAHFLQGISYGETGRYEEAIASINKAMESGSRKGLYLYGMGRVYLLSGEKNKATETLSQAAAMGNKDAIDYLNAGLCAKE